MLTIANSLDAVVAWRPYREALTFPTALKQLERGAGRQFDASIVEVIVREGESGVWSPRTSRESAA